MIKYYIFVQKVFGDAEIEVISESDVEVKINGVTLTPSSSSKEDHLQLNVFQLSKTSYVAIKTKAAGVLTYKVLPKNAKGVRNAILTDRLNFVLDCALFCSFGGDYCIKNCSNRWRFDGVKCVFGENVSGMKFDERIQLCALSADTREKAEELILNWNVSFSVVEKGKLAFNNTLFKWKTTNSFEKRIFIFEETYANLNIKLKDLKPVVLLVEQNSLLLEMSGVLLSYGFVKKEGIVTISLSEKSEAILVEFRKETDAVLLEWPQSLTSNLEGSLTVLII